MLKDRRGAAATRGGEKEGVVVVLTSRRWELGDLSPAPALLRRALVLLFRCLPLLPLLEGEGSTAFLRDGFRRLW